PRAAGVRIVRPLRVPGGLPRALLREVALPLRPARARGPVHVPGAGARRGRARRGARAAFRRGDGRGRLETRLWPTCGAPSTVARADSSRGQTKTRSEERRVGK